MSRLRFLPFLFILLTLTVSGAFAQDRSVVVQRRDADMTIQRDGSVDIVETWVVDFQGGPFRFAFRTIPYNKISSLVFDGVSENGQVYSRANSEAPHTFQTEAGSGEQTIRWFFPPTTNATRTFELRYRITDALRIYDGGDQFWWTFIEADRGYPINASRVTLHLPENFDPNELLAATYTNGRETDGAQIVDGQTIVFEGGPFPPDTTWEIRAQFPHGAVTQSVQPWQILEAQRAQQEAAQAIAVEQFSFYSTVCTWLLALGGGLALLLMWYVRGRDRAVTLPAEFLNAPPIDPATGATEPLTPALAGTLIDEEANVRDVLATLIDWAERGIIKIRALPQGAKTADVNDDYVYERIGTNAPPLHQQYERELMQRLFQGDTSRSIGAIRQKFTASLDEMFSSLYDELVRLGYFQKRPDRVRAQFYRFGWLLLVLLCPAAFLFQLFVGLTISDALPFSWLALAPWIILFIVAGAIMYLARYMPRKTDKGAEAAARWNAFRRYLEHIENYTNVADAKDQFEKYLPYAVAFGIDKTWVQKFSQVDTPAPTWYSPPTRGIKTSSSTRSASSSQPTPTRSSGGGMLSVGDVTPSANPSGGAPLLNSAASGTFNTLNSVSASFFSMLNTTATSFVASNPGLAPSRGSFRSGSSGGSSWSGGSSFGSSSSSRSSGGGGGGGRSGFG